MHLVDEIRPRIAAFVAGKLPPYELAGWLDSVAAEIHADSDPGLRPLTDRVLSLLAELSNGDRTTDDVRHELNGLLSQRLASSTS